MKPKLSESTESPPHQAAGGKQSISPREDITPSEMNESLECSVDCDEDCSDDYLSTEDQTDE